MSKTKSVWQWLVYSSADPASLSLTLKAGMTFLVFFGVEKETGTMLADGIVGFIVNLVQLVTLAGTIWGASRKIWYGIKKASVA